MTFTIPPVLPRPEKPGCSYAADPLAQTAGEAELPRPRASSPSEPGKAAAQASRWKLQEPSLGGPSLGGGVNKEHGGQTKSPRVREASEGGKRQPRAGEPAWADRRNHRVGRGAGSQGQQDRARSKSGKKKNQTTSQGEGT